jgi:bifunctional ADP-heptose synthase (sugar kinase/adenylyltransferase)
MREEVRSLIDTISQKTILVVGDAIVDKSTYSKALGISLESPTLKAEFIKETINIGGAANVARNIAALGGYPILMTAIDDNSIVDELKKSGVLLFNSWFYSTNVKHRFYVQQGNETYKHFQLNQQSRALDVVDAQHLVQSLENFLNKIDVIAFSDYRLGFINEELRNAIFAYAIKRNIPVYAASQVSSKEPNFDFYAGVDYLSMNHNEAKSIIDQWPDKVKRKKIKHKEIQFPIAHFKDLAKKGIYITNGEHGSTFSGYNCYSHASKKQVDILNNNAWASKVEVKNIIGAGDAFYAAVLAGCNDPVAANDLATLWAGLYVQKEYGELPCLNDLKNLK